MNSIKPGLILSILLLVMSSCTIGPTIRDGKTIITNADKSGAAVSLQFNRGANFTTAKKFGMFQFKITPQIAVWAEDTLGNYLQTIYVTHCFATQQWRMIKTAPDTCYRTTSLPYWMNAYMRAGHMAPTKNNPLPDAVTAATPTGSFTIKTKLDSTIHVCVIKAEFNKSFDPNASFGSQGSMTIRINGQPAVDYAARIDVTDKTQRNVPMHLIGRSGESGSDPALYTDTDLLTTAKSIFSGITITIE